MKKNGSWVLERGNFNALFDALAKRGYRVIGPTLRDGAIVLADLLLQNRSARIDWP